MFPDNIDKEICKSNSKNDKLERKETRIKGFQVDSSHKEAPKSLLLLSY